MLKQHIIDVLGDTNLSTEQRQRLVELLISIKEDDELVSEEEEHRDEGKLETNIEDKREAAISNLLKKEDLGLI